MGYVRQANCFLNPVFGKSKCDTTEFGNPETIKVSFPEGIYNVNISFKKTHWYRKRWRKWPFSRIRYYVNASMPIGIPFPGKGENAWDCGMDGLYGCSADYGRNYQEAISNIQGQIMSSIIRNRERYGGHNWTPTEEQYKELIDNYEKRKEPSYLNEKYDTFPETIKGNN